MTEFLQEYLWLIIIAGVIILTLYRYSSAKKIKSGVQGTFGFFSKMFQNESLKKTDWILPVIAVGVFHVLMYFSFEWYSKFVTNWRFWFTQVAIVGVFMFLRPINKKLRTPAKQLSGWGILVLVGLVLWNGTYLKREWWDNKSQEGKTVATLSSTREGPCPDVLPLGPVPGRNAEGEKKAREFWSKHTKSKEDLDQMMKIIERESQYNHLETDNTQPLVGRENCWDRGLHQINMIWWRLETEKFPEKKVLGKKISEIDPLKEEDNGLAALYLYENRGGLKPWDASTERKDFQIIIAPLGEWSAKIFNNKGLRTEYMGEPQPVQIRTEKGVFRVEIGERLDFKEPIKWIQFKSLGDKELVYKIEY